MRPFQIHLDKITSLNDAKKYLLGITILNFLDLSYREQPLATPTTSQRTLEAYTNQVINLAKQINLNISDPADIAFMQRMWTFAGSLNIVNKKGISTLEQRDTLAEQVVSDVEKLTEDVELPLYTPQILKDHLRTIKNDLYAR